MKTQSITLIYGTLATVVIILMAAHSNPSVLDPVKVLRAQKIELVDEKGKVHASMKIEENGETVFRLMDSDGTIRVKLGASKEGSGLVLLNDETSPGLHALAKADGTSLTLTNKNGQKQTITP